MKKSTQDKFPNTTSIRLPDGLKENLRVLLKAINERSGIYITRSEFMVMATKHYLQYLFEAKNDDDFKERLENYLK